MKKVMVSLIFINLLIGCSLFMPSTERLTVTTDQPDAEIFVNSQPIEPGMGSIKVKRNRDVVIMVSKVGYERSFHKVDTHLSITGILDIIGCLPTFGVTCLGLIAPGARALDETSVVIPLKPIPLRSVQYRQP